MISLRNLEGESGRGPGEKDVMASPNTSPLTLSTPSSSCDHAEVVVPANSHTSEENLHQSLGLCLWPS
jgi:hypothetical protein